MNHSENTPSIDKTGSGLLLPNNIGDKGLVIGRFNVQAHDPLTKQLLWEEEFDNLVVTQGKNDMLDKYFAGSGYTAAWYASLIDSAGYSAIVAGDTAASHAGWAEYTSYSESTRPAISWAAASAGAKSFASAVTFTIPSSITLKGCTINTVSTKGSTSGILYSAGLFTEGDRVITGSAILTVTYTTTLT